ncbi:MAG: putative zinc-binding metallopeptidase [Rhizobiaceae bacterium]
MAPGATKLFACPNCGNRLYFENAACLACGTDAVYLPFAAGFGLPGIDGLAACANRMECACNWAAADGRRFCVACDLNQTIPDLSVEGNRSRWTQIEAAKKRAIYSLIAFGLDISRKVGRGSSNGLAFDLLGDPIGAGPAERILTGHDSGLITLNVEEADEPQREKMRLALGERYRTLLGHFRHELGHYYWDRLVHDNPVWLDRFRTVFGDESADYATALQRHYANGAPPDWEERHISPYAASHAWEDWAESWAHYIHIADTLEMVSALHMPLGRLDAYGASTLPPNEANYADSNAETRNAPPAVPGGDFDEMLTRWLVLSEASNAINRCMGLQDLYPFVISEMTAEKLRFVHELLAEQAGKSGLA